MLYFVLYFILGFGMSLGWSHSVDDFWGDAMGIVAFVLTAVFWPVMLVSKLTQRYL